MGELGRRWQEWPGLYKVLLFAAPMVVVLAVLVILNLRPAPKYASLYGNLDLRDAAAMVKELQKQNVDYILRDEGTHILVPADQVYETRLMLAEKQLPFKTVGFELFDRTKLGVTETGQRVDYQRALEGELTRTLEEMPSVQEARVHLVIPQETSFLFDERKASASVMLVSAPGYTLSESQVQGVVHLVSHAVSDLSDKDVVVTDQNGNYLSGGLGGSVAFGLDNPSKQLEIKQGYEEHLERKVLSLLEPLYGAGNISVSVSVELDFNKVSRESERVSPVVGDSGLPVREKESRKRSEAGEGAAEGVPGTTSNIPGYLGVEATGGVQGETLDESEREVDYNVNREVESIDFAPGSVLRKSATVILSTEEWDDKRRAEVESWVQNAIAADPSRGDTVSVSAYIFTPTTPEELKGEVLSSARRELLSTILTWAGVFIILLLLFFVVRAIVGAAAGIREKPVTPEDLERMVGERMRGLAEGEEVTLPSLDEAKVTRYSKMKEEIVKLIREKPDEVANLVRAWLAED